VPDEERRRAERDGREPNAIPFLKRFTVFNTDQCEDLPREVASASSPNAEGLVVAQAETLIAATGADFRIGGDRAFYCPNYDFIQVPRPDAYFEPINWHRTALHELGHRTGAAQRLDRDLSGSFGSKKYAQEELVAEITSAFVCASLGIVPTVRHADYSSGSRSCERTIALAFAPPALRQRRQTTYLRSAPSPTNAKVSDQPTNLLVSDRRRHALDEAPEMPPQAGPSSVRGRPSSS
jgi:antirestriction protein ArdC